jgi:putative transposase
MELESKEILGLNISKERNMFVAEHFLSGIVDGEHPVSTDGGTWYPQACQFLKLKHLIERTMQYIKDRTEGFDDYFPCRKKNCKLKHVQQWLNLFAYYFNMKIRS